MKLFHKIIFFINHEKLKLIIYSPMQSLSKNNNNVLLNLQNNEDLCSIYINTQKICYPYQKIPPIKANKLTLHKFSTSLKALLQKSKVTKFYKSTRALNRVSDKRANSTSCSMFLGGAISTG